MRTSTLALLTLLALSGCSNLFKGGGSKDTEDTDDTDLPEDQVDDDGDGYTEEEGDCDDEDPDVGPGEDEIPYNGVDDDCDESTPDDDLDGDGYDHDEDCDDEDASRSPGHSETPYNGVDDDCDESTPDDDLDGDGFDHTEDCDDTDADVSPADSEVPYNGKDDDCDGSTPDDDLDGDGYDHDEDCDDEDATAYPGADEDPTDGVDNDCDGEVDERFDREVLDASSDCGFPSALAIDSADQLHVAYYDLDSYALRYTMQSTSGAWSTPADVLSDTANYSYGDWLDAQVDAADYFLVSYTTYDLYTDYLELDFIYRDTSGAWSVEYVVDDYANSGSTFIGSYVSMAVDDGNLPTFAYMDEDAGEPMMADYTSYGVALYTFVDYNYLGPTGYFTSLAVDSEGYDHITYADPSALGGFSPEVQYTKLDWDFDELAFSETVGDFGYYTSVALKSDDTVCVAYMLDSSADLVYGCRSGSSWSLETVDSAGSTGAWASLAFDADDEPWIAYYDETGMDLQVAHHDGSAWELIDVDTTGDVGEAADLAIASDGTVHITYYDATNGQLKHAWGM